MLKKLLKLRANLIKRAATQDADGEQWRNRMDAWIQVNNAIALFDTIHG